jgi:hypothetical protein
MAQLFYFDSRSNTVIHPDAIKLCPELSVLTEDETLCLILFVDNFSPFRQFAEQERLYRASMHVFSDNNPKLFNSLKWQSAVEAYKKLQFNPKLDLISTYQNKIKEMQTTIEAETSVTGIEKAIKTINMLRQQILELENEVSDQLMKDGQVKGGSELSFIEVWMRNKELYEAKFIKTKKQ